MTHLPPPPSRCQRWRDEKRTRLFVRPRLFPRTPMGTPRRRRRCRLRVYTEHVRRMRRARVVTRGGWRRRRSSRRYTIRHSRKWVTSSSSLRVMYVYNMHAHNVSQEMLMTEICTAVTYLRVLFTCYDGAHVHFVSRHWMQRWEIGRQQVTNNNNNNNMITLNGISPPPQPG